MKLVINQGYDGFNLSPEALALLCKLKGIGFAYGEISPLDPDLVRVVEELGDDANGENTKLMIIELKGM